MVKFVGIFSLKPGVDPDEAYKYWREKHTLWAKDKMLPDLRRYVTSRVVRHFGESDIYGFAELWFDDIESALRAVERLRSAQPDEWLTEWIEVPTRFLVTEEEVDL